MNHGGGPFDESASVARAVTRGYSKLSLAIVSFLVSESDFMEFVELVTLAMSRWGSDAY